MSREKNQSQESQPGRLRVARDRVAQVVRWTMLHPRTAGVGVMLLVCLLIFVFVWTRTPATQDFRTALAAALGVPVGQRDRFFLNLPVDPQINPGVLFVRNSREVAGAIAGDSPALERGPPISFHASETVTVKSSDALITKLFGGEFKSNGEVVLTASASDLKVVKWRSPPTLDERARASDQAKRWANIEKEVFVITAAYEATLTLELTGSSELAAEAKAKIKGYRAESERTSNGKTTTKFVAQQPVVFAFEADEVKFTPAHLGGIDNLEVERKPADSDKESEWERAKRRHDHVAALHPAHKRWACVTIASGFYSNHATWNHGWNRASADAVRQACASAGAMDAISLTASGKAPLTGERVLAFARDAVAEAKREGATFALVYYVGHMLSSKQRDLTLLMGDLPDRPTAVADAIGRGDGPGALRLGRLHATLGEAGLPFLLLVDGCLEDDDVRMFSSSADQFLEGSDLTVRGVVQDQLRELEPFETADEREEARAGLEEGERFARERRRQMNKYFDDERRKDMGGDIDDMRLAEDLIGRTNVWSVWAIVNRYVDRQPYLKSRNPVVLAASPGTFAYRRVTPITGQSGWSGPLAYDLYRAVVVGGDLDILSAVRQVTENKLYNTSAKERRKRSVPPSGSVSWSEIHVDFGR